MGLFFSYERGTPIRRDWTLLLRRFEKKGHASLAESTKRFVASNSRYPQWSPLLSTPATRSSSLCHQRPQISRDWTLLLRRFEKKGHASLAESTKRFVASNSSVIIGGSPNLPVILSIRSADQSDSYRTVACTCFFLG